MIKGIAHICISSNDLAAAERFYCGVLGLERRFVFERDGKLFGLYLAVPGGSFIEIFQGKANGGEGSIRHLCLEVEDIRAARERMAAKGVEVTEAKLGCDHSWQFWCKDPSGISIEFHQYTPESFQINGGTCVVNG